MQGRGLDPRRICFGAGVRARTGSLFRNPYEASGAVVPRCGLVLLHCSLLQSLIRDPSHYNAIPQDSIHRLACRPQFRELWMLYPVILEVLVRCATGACPAVQGCPEYSPFW